LTQELSSPVQHELYFSSIETTHDGEKTWEHGFEQHGLTVAEIRTQLCGWTPVRGAARTEKKMQQELGAVRDQRERRQKQRPKRIQREEPLGAEHGTAWTRSGHWRTGRGTDFRRRGHAAEPKAGNQDDEAGVKTRAGRWPPNAEQNTEQNQGTGTKSMEAERNCESDA
jgi:hypothetical protein